MEELVENLPEYKQFLEFKGLTDATVIRYLSALKRAAVVTHRSVNKCNLSSAEDVVHLVKAAKKNLSRSSGTNTSVAIWSYYDYLKVSVGKPLERKSEVLSYTRNTAPYVSFIEHNERFYYHLVNQRGIKQNTADSYLQALGSITRYIRKPLTVELFKAPTAVEDIMNAIEAPIAEGTLKRAKSILNVYNNFLRSRFSVQ